MSSSLTWLDTSAHDRRRALDVIDLFAIRDTADPAVRRTVAIANGVTDLVMAVVLLLAAVFGITSGFMAWMIVFFFALNTVSWLATTRET